jgi:hypothetical protein
MKGIKFGINYSYNFPTYMTNYIASAIQQFEYYKSLGEKTFAQLNDDSLFWQYNGDSNSVAIIVQHLCGNMLSRWTDFLTSDGEKEWRKRDQEFEKIITTKEELLVQWNKGWDCLFAALASITPSNIDTSIFIRAEKHSITEAINRQLAHYPYHVGQIVMIGKMCANNTWQSLSIPKGKSDAFNKEKFGK